MSRCLAIVFLFSFFTVSYADDPTQVVESRVDGRWVRPEGASEANRIYQYKATDGTYRPVATLRIADKAGIIGGKSHNYSFKEGDILFMTGAGDWYVGNPDIIEVEKPVRVVPVSGGKDADPYDVAFAQAKRMAEIKRPEIPYGTPMTTKGRLIVGAGMGANYGPPTAVASNGSGAIADAQYKGENGLWYRVRLYDAPGTVSYPRDGRALRRRP